MIINDYLWLKTIMKAKPLSIFIYILVIFLLPFGKIRAQSFKIHNISDKISIMEANTGENQLIVQSQKGMVVFDSFWSKGMALIFKEEISKALNRNDFNYVINTIDRLDQMGGNAAYKEAAILGHDSILEKYKDKAKVVETEIRNFIEMWRWKENVSRERLETHEKGSKKAKIEREWMNTCKRRADELEQGFSLLLPSITYSERKKLQLGDITLNLIWFGKGGKYKGMTVAVIPEEKTAVIPHPILHPAHLAPYPYSMYADLDVPRWISVLEEILEGENAVEKVICGINEVWSRERAMNHLEYIRRLWNGVRNSESEGKDLNEIQNQFSLDNEFAFVKKMSVYKEHGDNWVRPQHQCHVKLFFLQQKDLIAEKMILERGVAALSRIRDLRDKGKDIYIQEAGLNEMGYYWMGQGRIDDAIEIFKFNVELFPDSWNVYDSMAEAYMKDGNTKKAIKCYKKSLQLNPDNKNGLEMLKKLEQK